MTARRVKQVTPVPFQRTMPMKGRPKRGQPPGRTFSVRSIGDPSPEDESKAPDTTRFVGAALEPLVDFIEGEGFDPAQALAEGYNALSYQRAAEEADPDPINRMLRADGVVGRQAQRVKMHIEAIAREMHVDPATVYLKGPKAVVDGAADGHRPRKKP